MQQTYTTNDFLGGKIKLRQPIRGYRATSDAVLLAAAIMPKANQKILDIGTGSGAVALCLLARHPEVFVTGIELQQEMVDLAKENARLNHLEEKYHVVQADLRTPFIEGVPRGSFDWVVTNPPFMTEDQLCGTKIKDIAHRQGDCELKEWLDNALRYTTARGYFAMINRADRLPEILSLLHPRLGGICIYPIFTKEDQPAKRVIIVGRKSSKSPAKLDKGIILKDKDLNTTAKAEEIMRFGHPLF